MKTRLPLLFLLVTSIAALPLGAQRLMTSSDLTSLTAPPPDQRIAYGSGPLQFGNAPRVDGSVRGWPNYSEDVNVFKEFALRDPMKARFEIDFGNLFNRTLFCNPNTNWSSPAFGTVNTQCNQPRSIQFAVRLDF